ncbi:MAG TPA: AAA family ATPase [Pyrinomonadaceae bacterium]|nr:AAA family ATPase [Pyrinomonadaceae bacterium]
MLTEVMKHYGLLQEFRKIGYYETEEQKQMFKDIKANISAGKLIALTGVVGCGKTITLRKLQEDLTQEGKVLVSKSLSVDKSRSTLGTLITALFYDLSQEKEVKIPGQGEKRERELRDLIKKGKKPVALFVDEAHDLHHHTLKGLKRLIEMVEDNKGVLSIILAGHPKLKNDLRRPTMEEIGYRATIFALDNLIENRLEYLKWLVKSCLDSSLSPDEIIEPEALDLLAERLRTPLQIEQHLTLAFETAFQLGEKPISAAVIESVLSKQLDDLEPTLTRNGYTLKTLAEQFGAKPTELRALFRGQLEANRAKELQEQMLAAGLPL